MHKQKLIAVQSSMYLLKAVLAPLIVSLVAFRQIGEFAQISAGDVGKQRPALLYPVWPLQSPSGQHK